MAVALVPANLPASDFSAIYRQELLTNVLNPMVALFFLAFVPQFIAADSPAKFAAFVTLGVCFTITGTVWGLCLAWFSSFLGDRFRSNTNFAELLNRTAGALFVLLGIWLATTK